MRFNWFCSFSRDIRGRGVVYPLWWITIRGSSLFLRRRHHVLQLTQTTSLTGRSMEKITAHSFTAAPVWKCDYCSKAFGRTEHLKRHLLIHTKENTFRCTHCPKEFIRRLARCRYFLYPVCRFPHMFVLFAIRECSSQAKLTILLQ